MYKVLLVDDEIWSLEGLSKLFEWEKMGFSVIGQFTEPSEAFQMICSTEPDLVVTDIRMPEISGIELMNMSRNFGIQSEFVIVSGFSEFEYAQEALRLGAFDYQLKPIDPNEANLLLNRLKLHLEQKQMRSDRELFQHLMTGCINPLDLFKNKDRAYGGEYWQVMTCIGDTINIDSILKININHVKLKVEKNKTVMIANVTQSLEHDVIRLINETSKGYIGLSSISHDLENNLTRLVRESDLAASQYFIDQQTWLTKYTSSRNIELESIVLKTERWIIQKNHKEICRLIDKVPVIFEQKRLGMYHVTSLWNQFAIIISRRLDGDFMTRIDFLDYEGLLHRFQNLSSMCAYIKKKLLDICYSNEESTAKKNKYNQNFIALLNYVNNHYNENISLSELAEKFYLNMSYCSELFKKVTGYTYSDYITKTRMENAAEMIQSNNYTIEQICDLTGYNDYYYFCKVFKKFHGVTPSQFSKRMMMLTN